MTKVHDLAKLGQSIWLDYIRRAFLESGEFEETIADGVSGVTSNPSIFKAAIAGSADYDAALVLLADEDKSPMEIYERLAIEDIRQAADMLRPIYDQNDGRDGFVSLEVSPELAHDTEGTVTEARRLYATVDRPNVMIKVPATPAGIMAIERLIGQGVNINVTLMFSLAHYEAVAEAYLHGLETLAAQGRDLSRTASVASFFLSRIDSAVDDQLAAIGSEHALALQGKIAVASAKLAYHRFQERFSGERWERLAGQGARPQRVLWASTSTKNPSYPDTLYVDQLIGPGTVNTVPPATLLAFLDHGTVALTVTDRLDEARAQLALLSGIGIDLDQVSKRLQAEGVDKFVKPFRSLLVAIDEKVAKIQAHQAIMEVELASYQSLVDKALAEVREQEIMRRIWAHDHTVWKPDPAEISNRLGWLHSPELMADSPARIQSLLQSARDEGYTEVLLLGMGGSSLAPEVFSHVFGQETDGLNLAVLDSTDPGAVRAYADKLDPAKTLFIVSTKSGGTVETLSFFKYFHNQTAAALGVKAAGEHFIAITDEGSRLHQIAQTCDFRETFLNDPNIGGRYSALSYFGLVPAGLVGVDLERLLDRAQVMACNNESSNCPVDGDNLGAQLGVIMGELAKQGRDKLTLITSPGLANFGDWVEQLIAESTGKEGKGILPVVGESVGEPELYGQDRLFIYLRLNGDETYDEQVADLVEAGYPLVTLHLQDRYDLGAQFFLWEMATAVAGARLGIQPFNQPNVEAAKVLARKMVAEYQDSGQLPTGDVAPLTVEALTGFLEQAEAGDYIALQVYVEPTEENDKVLSALREKLRTRTKLATTLGYGPRFLHSTGQLHKGDGGNGLFIQIISVPKADLAIPDEAGEKGSSITFGILKSAQALGDAQALQEAGRKVIRFQLAGDTDRALSKLNQGL